nr:sigma-70 family RNA polymerase sigma factor [Pedobacter xinjiangensis]
MEKGISLTKEWNAFVNNKDEQAYLDIYAHYYNYLNFVGLKKGFSLAKVKDSINDTFLYLWENHGKMICVVHHHNYIITAFLRKLYKKEKFNAGDSIVLDDLPEFLLSPSVEETYITKQSQSASSRVLQNYVEQLPAKQRQLIYQKFYLGLSYQEIADTNGISINTVYNTIYKAVDKLKLLLEKEQTPLLTLAITTILFLFVFFFK